MVNPHRRLRQKQDPLFDAALQELLLRAVRYTGNPDHKKKPGDFGLERQGQPRLHASLCDEAGIERRATALALLRDGVRNFLLSEQQRGEFPALIWSVRHTDKVVFEARLENETLGSYHGYPLQMNDPLRDEVLGACGLSDA